MHVKVRAPLTNHDVDEDEDGLECQTKEASSELCDSLSVLCYSFIISIGVQCLFFRSFVKSEIIRTICFAFKHLCRQHLLY